MKKALILSIALAFVFTMAAPLLAADLPKPVDKLAKGTMDVVKSPLVIIDHTKKEVDSADFKAVGLVKGLALSPFHLIKKAGTAAIDIATFPIE